MSQLEVSSLRNADSAHIVQFLKSLLPIAPLRAVTSALREAVVCSGTLSPLCLHIWLDMVRDAGEAASVLREVEDINIRKHAFRGLYRCLRREDSFAAAWDAVGRAEGIAALMAGLSVYEVRLLCTYLGRTASARERRAERQAALAELVRLLTAPDAQDPRPLRSLYQSIVPAATAELVIEWERAGATWTLSQQQALARGHPDLFKDRLLEGIFSADKASEGSHAISRFGKESFWNNWEFISGTLNWMDERERKVQFPSNFIGRFLLPCLKKSVKSRRGPELLASMFDRVARFVGKHEPLAKELTITNGGLFHLAVERWIKLPNQREQFEKVLILIIAAMPPSLVNGMGSVQTMLLPVEEEFKYTLLRLIFRHARSFEVDIDDDSAEGIDNLRKLPKNLRWPAGFFTTYLDNGSALAVFGRLMKAYPDASFLLPTYGNTVLTQLRDPRDSGGDPEVVLCRLIVDSTDPRGKPGSTWHTKVTALVEERKKKAAQSRESSDRAFWAKSALRLCIAAQRRELYGETMLWARRFNRDSLTLKELYSADVLETIEAITLLVAFRASDVEDKEWVGKNIEAANQILHDMLETAAMSISEPGFQSSNWSGIGRLIDAVVTGRLGSIADLEKKVNLTKPETLEAVWKPTIDMLFKTQQFIAKPGQAALPIPRPNRTGASVAAEIAHTQTPPQQAKLASYLMERMSRDLDPTYARMSVSNLVEIVKLIAAGGQPSLAWPFISDMVIDGEENSSWHRQLLKPAFLSRLPAQEVREFLHGMTETICQRLRDQNARRGRPPGATESTSKQPYVKVTTVKLLAAILKDTLFIDGTSACNILLTLLPHAQHIDIHTAVVESLLSILGDLATPVELKAKILDSLAKYTVPVVSRLNERVYVTEEDWAAAASADAPDLEVAVSSGLPSILRLFITEAKRDRCAGRDKKAFARIMVAVLEQSVANNARWMDLFLKKRNLSLAVGEKLPKAPANLNFLGETLDNFPQYMPKWAFEMLRNLVLANLDPPPSIAKITQFIRSDKELYSSNAGMHWLEQFNKTGSDVLSLGVRSSIAVLKRVVKDEITPETENAVTKDMLRRFVLDIAGRVIASGDSAALDALVGSIYSCHPAARANDRMQHEVWEEHCRPILLEIAERVESARPVKHGKTRSNAFQIRAWALQTPFYDPESLATDAEVESYIRELSGLIDRLATRRLPYHEDWAPLKQDCKLGSNKDFAQYALVLGSLDDIDLSGPSLGDYLRVELAGELLAAAYTPRKPGVIEAARELVAAWLQCENEAICAMGNRAFDKLSGRYTDPDRNWFVDKSQRQKGGGGSERRGSWSMGSE